VDLRDVRFNELRLWQDRNGNHVTDAGELSSLTEGGVTSLSTRYTLAPEQQSGNWLVERSTATLADGRTVATADAYFEIDPKDAAAFVTAQTRKREEDRGASIIVGSKLPSPPETSQPILLAGAVLRGTGINGEMPVIDWTASLRLGNGSFDETEERKKMRGKQSWLTDFLGVAAQGKERDLVQQTGLKVVLNAQGRERV
jgi:hypothetical protein